MSSPSRTPLLFIGHGNPLNVILDNRFTKTWEKIGKEIVAPKVIVCLSAHWLTEGSFVSTVNQPDIIYDFYGFPEELYRVLYEVKGDPKTANSIHTVEPKISLDTQWGIDHGAWTVLKRMFPSATIPVIQISIDYSAPPSVQFELLKKLRDFRNQGVLFIGSGNIVHNLRLAGNSAPYDWALEFESQAKNLLAKGDSKSLLEYQKLGKSAELSIPTDDHYRPLINTLALKYDDEEPVFFNEGIDLASVSMLSLIYK